jgi:hypothetical protein
MFVLHFDTNMRSLPGTERVRPPGYAPGVRRRGATRRALMEDARIRTHDRRPGRRRRRQSTLAEVAIVVAVGLAVLLGGLAPTLASRTAATEDSAASAETMDVVVREGDTLWALARTCAGPDGDAAAMLEAIRAANGGDVALVPGDIVAIPCDPGAALAAGR